MEDVTFDSSYMEALLEDANEHLEEIVEYEAQSAETLQQMYTAQLFGIGVTGAVLVCVILYKFLRLFF